MAEMRLRHAGSSVYGTTLENVVGAAGLRVDSVPEAGLSRSKSTGRFVITEGIFAAAANAYRFGNPELSVFLFETGQRYFSNNEAVNIGALDPAVRISIAKAYVEIAEKALQGFEEGVSVTNTRSASNMTALRNYSSAASLLVDADDSSRYIEPNIGRNVASEIKRLSNGVYGYSDDFLILVHTQRD